MTELWNLLNSNFSSALLGAISGSGVILFIEYFRQQRRLLADINALMASFACNINDLLVMKSQFVVPMNDAYSKDLKKIEEAEKLPPSSFPPLVHFSPFLHTYPVPDLLVEVSLENIFAQSDREPRIAQIVFQAKNVFRLIKDVCEQRNLLVQEMSGMKSDEMSKVYFAKKRFEPNGSMTNTKFPDLQRALTVYVDDGLFFSQLAIDFLRKLGEKVLPFWLRGKIGTFEVKGEQNRALMPSADHLKEWRDILN